MICNLKVDMPLFVVENINRNGDNKRYWFVDNQEDETIKILSTMEQTKKIDKIKLKSILPSIYNDIIKDFNNNKVVKFIYDKIRIDDSINDIKKKIFVYCSEPDTNYFIEPKNQMLWININDVNKYKILGYSYNNYKITKPFIYEERKIDSTFIDLYNTNKLEINTSENYIVLYDIFKQLELNNTPLLKNVIYITCLQDEIKYIEKKKKVMTEDLINGYLKKYFPAGIINIDINESKSNYIIYKENILKENAIFSLIKFTPDEEKIKAVCSINTIWFNINTKQFMLQYMGLKEDEKPPDFIDLYQIFTYICKNKIMSNKLSQNNKRDYSNEKNIIFIRYNDISISTPFNIISQYVISNNYVDKNLLLEWTGYKNTKESEKIRDFQGIQMRQYIRDYNGFPKYSHIQFTKWGNIRVSISYYTDYNATMNDVILIIHKLRDLMIEINNNVDYRTSRIYDEKLKIPVPDMSINNGEVILNKNTEIMSINLIVPYSHKHASDFDTMYKFGENFEYMLSPTPDDKIEKTTYHIRYNRVSGFANMNKIMAKIDDLKSKNIKDEIIAAIIEKQDNKTLDEAFNLIKEWNKKYKPLSGENMTLNKTGIDVVIGHRNIKLNGVNKIYQIIGAYNFFIIFLTYFFNYETLQHNKYLQFILGKSKSTVSIEQLEQKDIELDQELLQLKEGPGIVKDINFNTNNMLSSDNTFSFDEGNNNNNSSLKKILKSKHGRTLASNDEISSDVKMICDDPFPVPELDYCQDLCKEAKYILRRLQHYDIKLFRFMIDKKQGDSTYSRGCQRNSQPIIIDYDPEKPPDDVQPIKRDSFTYTFKYNSDPNTEFPTWYICPKVWCPYCEIPLSLDEIDMSTYIQKDTEDSGGQCATVQCSRGDHRALFRVNDAVYPGFLKKSIHPAGLCLPCCYEISHLSKPHYKKCLGQITNNTNESNDIISYILGREIPISNGRFGILNIDIARILGTKINTGYIDIKRGYVRHGISQNQNNEFLTAIGDIISCNKNNNSLTLGKLKNMIIDNITPELFDTLLNGNLKIIFTDKTKNITPLDNFISFFKSSSISLTHEYIWDLLQLPGILDDKGLNIFIFESDQLICPPYANFYNTNRKTILLVKHKQYYEPIYYIEGHNKKINYKCIFDNSTQEILYLFDIYNNNYHNINIIDWQTVLLDNIKKYHLSIDTLSITYDANLEQTLDTINKAIMSNVLNNSFKPIMQIVDYYNKVYYILLENKLVIPVKPSHIILSLPYKTIINLSDLSFNSYDDNYSFLMHLSTITALNIKPVSKIRHITDNNMIVAFYTENNRIIPIIPTTDKSDTLKYSNVTYYSNVDEFIKNDIKLIDKRIDIINKKKFENECYQRIRFELSRYLQSNTSIKNNIIDIINNNNSLIESRKLLYPILDKIFKDLLVTDVKHKIEYANYIPSNIRQICSLSENDNDMHCLNGKLYVNKYNAITNKDNYLIYSSMIIEELLRITAKRNEILFDTIHNVLNKENIDNNDKYYYIISGNSMNEIERNIDLMYINLSGIKIDNRLLWEYSISSSVGFDKGKYDKYTSLIEDSNSVKHEMPIYIDELLNNSKYIIISNKYYNLFINLVYSLKTVYSSIVDYTNIKQAILDFINNPDINYIDVLSNYFINRSFNVYNSSIIVRMYKETVAYFDTISSINELITEFSFNDYNGCDIDIAICSKIYEIGFIIFNERYLSDANNIVIFPSKNNNYILLLKMTHSGYSLIIQTNKYIFNITDLPPDILNKKYIPTGF